MALKITLKTTSDFQIGLDRLAGKSDEIAKKAVYVGAGIMADQVRVNLRKNLSGSKLSQGDLLDSLGISKPKVDQDGSINSKVGFDGYDRNGVPNTLKARVMESGSSKQKKKPFIRPAISQARNKAKEAMAKVIDTEIEKIMGGK
jgi:HK97 gp10 family phage protein